MPGQKGVPLNDPHHSPYIASYTSLIPLARISPYFLVNFFRSFRNSRDTRYILSYIVAANPEIRI